VTVKVKICGITNAQDALAAIAAGADALGFMFCAQSPRCLTPQTAADIIRQLPPFIAKVGVFVDPSAMEIYKIVDFCGLDTLPLHGNEPPGFCRQFSVPVIKAFRIQDAESLEPIANYQTAAWLLDSYVPGKSGGTGATFNWDLARQAKKLGGRLILAGGLTPQNVAEAVQQVQPYAVDVSSGVESAPGKKDATRMWEFIAAAKGFA
jgi:phosphoribosylanthranilate isomerase